ncbi:MAG: hypothetical protein Q8943_19560 [Bacteroidota bacterium]|nr:hypothetical protein [Bacteroidota bacterium]
MDVECKFGDLGKETAENLTSFIDFKITEEMNNHFRVLATRQEMMEGFALARQELTEGLAEVRQEVSTTKAEIIKWMFIFWVGQLLAMIGLIHLFLKK